MNLKRHMRLIIAFSIIMLANSCKNKGYEFPQAPIQVNLTDENMPPIEYFTLEEVEIPEAAQMDRWYYLHADTLLFTVQNKRPNPYILSVYNLKTKEFFAGYFTKGMGPGELISASCDFRNNEIIVIDAAQKKVAVLNIDSIATFGYNYIPTIISTDGICTNYTRCVDDTLIAINNFHFYGYGYEHVPEFLKILCGDGKFPKDYLPKKIVGSGPMNINMRFSYFNKHTKQYVVAWRNYPYINIYDEKFSLQKQYVGPDDYNQKLVEYEVGLYFYPDTVCARFYTIGCQTENHIFYVNDRACGIRFDRRPANAEVYCFDKSLNLVRRLKQKDPQSSFLLLPSYSEETGNLYFEVKNEDSDGYVLCKCIFDK